MSASATCPGPSGWRALRVGTGSNGRESCSSSARSEAFSQPVVMRHEGGLTMKPILLAVHDEPRDRDAIQRELTSRYAADYEIICEDSPVSALQRLDALGATPGGAVLVLFAASDMAAMSGVEYLQRAHERHPHARRVLLIPWSNRSASKPILRMISQERFDRYATVPGRSKTGARRRSPGPPAVPAAWA